MTDEPENAGRDQAGRFRAGRSGNARGKPRGTRHKATILAEQLLAGELEGVVRAVVTAAIGGDMQAAGLILGRMLPVRRGRPVCVPMPVVRTAADALAAVSAVTAAVAAGDVTPDEAATLASLAETAVRVVAVAQLESRIVALETARDQGERTDR